jgi:hypothetical protein
LKILSRRRVVNDGLLALAGLAMLLEADNSGAAAADSCAEAATESLRASLHYVNPSPVPDQSCSSCAFFSGGEIAPACGKCTIMTGTVNPKAHCDSWSAKD